MVSTIASGPLELSTRCSIERFGSLGVVRGILTHRISERLLNLIITLFILINFVIVYILIGLFLHILIIIFSTVHILFIIGSYIYLILLYLISTVGVWSLIHLLSISFKLRISLRTLLPILVIDNHLGSVFRYMSAVPMGGIFIIKSLW